MISNSIIKAALKVRVQTGDSFTRRFTFTDVDGIPLDLSLHSFKLSVKDVEGAIILEWLNADFIPVSMGVYDISKTATQMNIEPGSYTYDLQVTYPNNGEQRTWIFGNFEAYNQTTL